MAPAGEPPRFPAGPFAPEDDLTPGRRSELVDELANAPRRLREAVRGLSEAQLEARYRDWTIRQIVHHVADSHVNGYARFRLALTEDQPTIKPFLEGPWARLPDAHHADVALSLNLLDALHARWAQLLKAMPAASFARTYVHPEAGQVRSLDFSLADYAWHGRHHIAAIVWVRKRQGW